MLSLCLSGFIASLSILCCLRVLSLALKLLSDPGNVPAMINCAAGKDRTGVITALVLWCVGWSKDDIIADYAKSQVVLRYTELL